MRILVISDLPQFVIGGAEIQAARLMGAWIRAGHSVRCLGRRIVGTQTTIDGHPIAVARIATLRNFGRSLRALTYFVSLSRLLIKHRATTDVVCCQFLNEAATTVAALKMLGLWTTPVVALPASVGGHGDAFHLRSVPGWRWLVRLLDAQIDRINLIAPAMEDELRSIGFSGRAFQRIPNGVQVLPMARSSTRRRQWIFVGRLAREKALDVLMTALERIEVPESPPTILIAGDGPERQDLMQRAAANPWQQQIRFVGRVTESEVRALLDESELFLLPSRFEGMTNAGLEAMERGVPVLLSACGGLDRYVTAEHGWVVAPNDVHSLREALLDVLSASPSELASKGIACRKLVETEFDIEVIARRYLEMFSELILKRPDDSS